MCVNAYGRYLEVLREGETWVIFDVGNEGRKRPAGDIRIPPSVGPGQVETYLGDLLHEYATARHPAVRILE